MTTPLTDLSPDDLSALHEQLSDEHAELVARGVSLNITRGKPSPAQLDLNADLLTIDVPSHAEDGQDVRNYGGNRGLTEIRRIFGELLGVDVDHIIAADNSSLSIMHDLAMFAFVHGIAGEKPWFGQNVKFIAPVPGYDRHFAICEHLGIEMIPVELGEHGPDVDEVAKLAADPSVKGMWVVPMYANPNGVVYDEETVPWCPCLPPPISVCGGTMPTPCIT